MCTSLQSGLFALAAVLAVAVFGAGCGRETRICDDTGCYYCDGLGCRPADEADAGPAADAGDDGGAVDRDGGPDGRDGGQDGDGGAPECRTDDDCRPGHPCVGGLCRTPCDTHEDCLRFDVQFSYCLDGYCATTEEATGS